MVLIPTNTSTLCTSPCESPPKLTIRLASAPSRHLESCPHVEQQRLGNGWRANTWPSSPTTPVSVKKTLKQVLDKPRDNNYQSHHDTMMRVPSVSSSSMASLLSPLKAFGWKKNRDQQPQDDDDLDQGERVFPVHTETVCEIKRSSSTNHLVDLCSSNQKLSLASIHIRQCTHDAGTDADLLACENDSMPLLLTEATLKKSSVYQELDEFRKNPDAMIAEFPSYFCTEEQDLVKQTAEELELKWQLSGGVRQNNNNSSNRLLVFKAGSTYDKTSNRTPATQAFFARNNDEVYVDVSELAQQGQDGFIARLQLRRLNSGGGLRRKMLWDVAQLSSSTDGVADPVAEGEGGVYAVQSRSSGEKLAMFKPAEEEKFVREGLFPGEGAIREEAAYVLDLRCNGFSGVPPTAVARLQLSQGLNGGRTKQNGAVQRFMRSSIGSMENFGMPFDLEKAAKFVPVDQVHRIGVLDIRLFNTDRHPGNILLIGDKAPYTMVPIDHGCILPSWFHLSEARFDWLDYPQCKAPFSNQAREYVASLDADADAQALRRLGIREECIVTLQITTKFLQLAVLHGKTLHWIGTFLQRDGCFEEPSMLEELIQRACSTVGIPFVFKKNEFNEQKGSIPLGILSRRPPREFFVVLERLLEEAITSVVVC